MKFNILFVTQTNGKDTNEPSHCGVGIRGKLTSDILKKSTKYNYIQCFVNDHHDVDKLIFKYRPNIIIYNFHGTTTKWIYEQVLVNKYPHIHHVMIHYDIQQEWVDNFSPDLFCGCNYVIVDDETITPTKNVFVVPRSLPCDGLFNNCTSPPTDIPSVPKIGFQGFGFPHKGIDHLAWQVQAEFDNAILRLHMPNSYYGDPDGEEARARLAEVKSIITKPGIIVEVSNKFLDDNGIVCWLHENDLNCYFYDYQDGCGIATSPDYAISARKPIAVTHSYQLRNFWKIPSVLIENNSLRTIMKNGTKPLEPLYQRYSEASLIKAYDNICDHLIPQ